VFHGTPSVLILSELVRSYNNLVEEATRVMQRIKAMFRARAIPTKGTAIYRPSEPAQGLAQLEDGARSRRCAALFKHLDVLVELRLSGERLPRFWRRTALLTEDDDPTWRSDRSTMVRPQSF